MALLFVALQPAPKGRESRTLGVDSIDSPKQLLSGLEQLQIAANGARLKGGCRTRHSKSDR